jgi:aryl-alcohol dehydrogenase-like predicted oxidoreductase
VSELCLGAMIFGDRRGGWGASRDEAAGIVERFAEAGGNFVDTANSHAGGESERIVGEPVTPERERWAPSTKYALTMRPDDPNGGGAHRKGLVQSLEAGLRRLGTGYLDPYRVHVWDAFTPVEEVVGAPRRRGSAGKVLYAERAHLEEVSRIELAFPHDFGADRLAYGTTRPLIDSHRHPTAHT